MQEVRGFDSHRLHPLTSTYAVGATSITRLGCLTGVPNPTTDHGRELGDRYADVGATGIQAGLVAYGN